MTYHNIPVANLLHLLAVTGFHMIPSSRQNTSTAPSVCGWGNVLCSKDAGQPSAFFGSRSDLTGTMTRCPSCAQLIFCVQTEAAYKNKTTHASVNITGKAYVRDYAFWPFLGIIIRRALSVGSGCDAYTE